MERGERASISFLGVLLMLLLYMTEITFLLTPGIIPRVMLRCAYVHFKTVSGIKVIAIFV